MAVLSLLQKSIEAMLCLNLVAVDKAVQELIWP